MLGLVCFCVKVETGEPGQKRHGLKGKTSNRSGWTQKSASDANPDHINQERETIAFTTARLITTLLTAWGMAPLNQALLIFQEHVALGLYILQASTWRKSLRQTFGGKPRLKNIAVISSITTTLWQKKTSPFPKESAEVVKTEIDSILWMSAIINYQNDKRSLWKGGDNCRWISTN